MSLSSCAGSLRLLVYGIKLMFHFLLHTSFVVLLSVVCVRARLCQGTGRIVCRNTKDTGPDLKGGGANWAVSQGSPQRVGDGMPNGRNGERSLYVVTKLSNGNFCGWQGWKITVQ